jgi:hypothetical protein
MSSPASQQPLANMSLPTLLRDIFSTLKSLDEKYYGLHAQLQQQQQVLASLVISSSAIATKLAPMHDQQQFIIKELADIKQQCMNIVDVAALPSVATAPEISVEVRDKLQMQLDALLHQ